jgi:hypothetical protein
MMIESGVEFPPLYRFLDTVGDGSGTKNARGNYAIPKLFKIMPPAGSIYKLRRMMVQIESSGSPDAGKYGDSIVLTNGIFVKIYKRGRPYIDLTDGLPIITNTNWGRVCYDVGESTYGQGTNYVSARWTFGKAGVFIQLDGDKQECFAVVLNDNFNALVSHTFMVQGAIVQGDV